MANEETVPVDAEPAPIVGDPGMGRTMKGVRLGVGVKATSGRAVTDTGGVGVGRLPHSEASPHPASRPAITNQVKICFKLCIGWIDYTSLAFLRLLREQGEGKAAAQRGGLMQLYSDVPRYGLNPDDNHGVIWLMAFWPFQASTTVEPLVSQPSYSVPLPVVT